MRFFKIQTAIVFALTLSATGIFAQWPSYPTPGPRAKDGKIDFAAPTPQTPDGHPDFSGLWEPAHVKGGRGGGMNGTPPLPFPIPTSPGDPPVAQFFNIGAGFKDGLLPFTPWGAQVRAQRKGNNNKDNPDALCLPLGLTQLHMHPQPREIVQTPREIVVLYEANGNVRRILTDGRGLPNNDPTPWFYGYSVGHWDGDTLVVETTGFRDDVWLDVEGSPLTSTGKMTERWRRPKFGLMQIDITIEDPKAYTKPFTVRVNHQLMPDTELMEFVCQDRDATHYVGKGASK
ncbi:MAG TPA: hypothetical protein VMU80_10410 [Bryobacteraceae bacterium]|nr:hypothetical protein [Bryobacteraceae bacterium]HUO29621.1 hypothetical protein [Bryobacteraceae bacterium]